MHHRISVKGEHGVRYTVPSYISPQRMPDRLTVRFRVGNVYKNASICVYFNDTCVSRKKKRVLSPGEMENAVLKKADLEGYDGLKEHDYGKKRTDLYRMPFRL